MTRPEIDKALKSNAQEDQTGYTRARKNCVFYPVPEPGVLRINGPDRLDFLQRQTTNDLKLLSPGHLLTTILTSAAGRVLDVLILLDLPAEDPQTGAYLAITLPGKGSQTAGFLQKKIFFMDKVTVEDVSTSYRLFALEGPDLASALKEADLPTAPGESEVMSTALNTSSVLLFSLPPQMGTGVRLVALAAGADELSARLSQASAEAIDLEIAEILRVERGLPGVKGEFTGEYTPLETNLDWAISDKKGCYTGQEVIARQITYDKVTRKLVGLKLEAEAAVRDDVWVEGKVVGTVTSFAFSRAAAHWPWQSLNGRTIDLGHRSRSGSGHPAKREKCTRSLSHSIPDPHLPMKAGRTAAYIMNEPSPVNDLQKACLGELHPMAKRGFELFDERKYWHAHEALETAWLEEPGPVRDLYRGVLQAGVVYLHVQRENYRGAVKVYHRCRRWLDPFPDHCLGLDIRQLRHDLETVFNAVRKLGPDHLDKFDHKLLKPIAWTAPSDP